MGEVEKIEAQVESLAAPDLAKFRSWFLEFDARVWDRKIEADSASVKLDKLLSEARSEFSSGKAREL